ncbi:hypothetical protein B0T21DRAFT_407594 [Apiosordaria backusii]|uniref:Uncharacterized protein n=1 Tax=Apiosordaria backusii TaxID=314023 RepID=A0AA40K3F1_9PEZI|nr:hypothetical protein B0T21DRAFT_407594 [Apiosordaria backusii]
MAAATFLRVYGRVLMMKGMMALFKGASATLKELLKNRVNRSGRAGDDLETNMYETHKRILCKIKQGNQGASSDTLSRAMKQFIDPIQKISATGDKGCVETAYHLLTTLRKYSFDASTPGNGKREPDGRADRVLASLIRVWEYAKRTDPKARAWWANEWEILVSEAGQAMEAGIQPWYPETKKALEETPIPSKRVSKTQRRRLRKAKIRAGQLPPGAPSTQEVKQQGNPGTPSA